ncbi:MAG: hypothetical protein KJ626_00970 [Verrucomicrobia bacterium]|nr:hypothetical protein [Verrucomicrobiota bacterium]
MMEGPREITKFLNTFSRALLILLFAVSLGCELDDDDDNDSPPTATEEAMGVSNEETPDILDLLHPYLGSWYGSASFNQNETNYIATVNTFKLEPDSARREVALEFHSQLLESLTGTRVLEIVTLSDIGVHIGFGNYTWDDRAAVLGLLAGFPTTIPYSIKFTSHSTAIVSIPSVLGTNTVPLVKN